MAPFLKASNFELFVKANIIGKQYLLARLEANDGVTPQGVSFREG